MIISDRLLRSTIRQHLLNEKVAYRRADFTVDLHGDGEEVKLTVGDYTTTFERSANNTVWPTPVWGGVDYSKKITSPPQEKRSDVGNVTDSTTGEEVARGNRPHRGYDFGTPTGTPIVAFANGKVISINTDESANAGGIYIGIMHDNGYKTTSMHMSKLFNNKGDVVKAGQVIGLSGKTGKITGPHLHFSITKPGESKQSFDKSLYDTVLSNAAVATVKLKEDADVDTVDDSTTAADSSVTANKFADKTVGKTTVNVNNTATDIYKFNGIPYGFSQDEPSKLFRRKGKGKDWEELVPATDKEIIDQMNVVIKSLNV